MRIRKCRKEICKWKPDNNEYENWATEEEDCNVYETECGATVDYDFYQEGETKYCMRCGLKIKKLKFNIDRKLCSNDKKIEYKERLKSEKKCKWEDVEKRWNRDVRTACNIMLDSESELLDEDGMEDFNNFCTWCGDPVEYQRNQE